MQVKQCSFKGRRWNRQVPPGPPGETVIGGGGMQCDFIWGRIAVRAGKWTVRRTALVFNRCILFSILKCIFFWHDLEPLILRPNSELCSSLCFKYSCLSLQLTLWQKDLAAHLTGFKKETWRMSLKKKNSKALSLWNLILGRITNVSYLSAEQKPSLINKSGSAGEDSVCCAIVCLSSSMFYSRMC